MASATLMEFLEQYTKEIPPSVQPGVIEDIQYTRETLNTITFIARFPHIVPYADVVSFERSVAKALEAHCIRLEPRYDGKLLTKDCIPELIEMLKRELPIVNGFLYSADWEWSGDKLHVELKNGGYPILQKFQFTQTFEKLVQRVFDATLHITLHGEDTLSHEALERVIESAPPDYEPAPPPPPPAPDRFV